MYRDNAYYAPNIEIIEVKVEEGICTSPGGNGGSAGTIPDDDEFQLSFVYVIYQIFQI